MKLYRKVTREEFHEKRNDRIDKFTPDEVNILLSYNLIVYNPSTCFANSLIITKGLDEWFYTSYSTNHSGTNRSFFICDQIEGVCEFLDDYQ